MSRLGIDADGRLEIRHGQIEVTVARIGIAPIAVGKSGLGVDPNRRAVIGDGAVEVVLVLIFNAAAQVDFRKLPAPELARRNGAGTCRDGSVPRLLCAGVPRRLQQPPSAPLRESRRSSIETTSMPTGASASHVVSEMNGRSRGSRLTFLLGADPAPLVGGATRMVHQHDDGLPAPSSTGSMRCLILLKNRSTRLRAR